MLSWLPPPRGMMWSTSRTRNGNSLRHPLHRPSCQSLPSAEAERDNGPTYDLVGFWPACESLMVNSSNRFLFAAGIT